MKHLSKKILLLVLCCLLTLCSTLVSSAESVNNLVKNEKIKFTETQIFSFDTELTAWSTSRVHSIDIQNAKEGSGCYSVTYVANTATHQLVSSSLGAFELNVKDVQHTALMIDLYLSDYTLVAPLFSNSVSMLTAQLYDINGKVLEWQIPCTYSGWNTVEIQLWNTDSTLQDESQFNFNHVVKFAITGTVYSGLTVKFDHLRLVDYTDTTQRIGAPYDGRLIADFDQGSLEGLVFDEMTGYYNNNKDQITNGTSGWEDYLRLEQKSGQSIDLRGLSIPVDPEKDVFCFTLFLNNPEDVSSAKIILEDVALKFSITERSVLNAYSNGGLGLQKGINLVRIPLKAMTREGIAETVTLRRVSLTLYTTEKTSASSQDASQSNDSSANAQTQTESSVEVRTVSSDTSTNSSDPASSSQTDNSTTPSILYYTVDQMYLTTSELLNGDAGVHGAAPSMGTPCELKMIYSNPIENNISSTAVSLITGSTANISINTSGSYDILQAGIYWGDVSYNLKYRTTANIQDPQSKLFTIDLLGLKPNKTYFLQAYIMTEKGETRGQILSFTTTTGLTVTTRCSTGGTVTPSGITTVKQGDSLCINITPDPGYYLASLTVDEQLTTYTEEEKISQYTFNDISTGHTLFAQFEPLKNYQAPTVSDSSSTNDTDTTTDNDSASENNLLKILLWILLSIAILSIALMLLLPLLSKQKKDDKYEHEETNQTADEEDLVDTTPDTDAVIDSVVVEDVTTQAEQQPQGFPLTQEQIPEVAPVVPPVPLIIPVDSFRVENVAEEDILSDGFRVELNDEEESEEL